MNNAYKKDIRCSWHFNSLCLLLHSWTKCMYDHLHFVFIKWNMLLLKNIRSYWNLVFPCLEKKAWKLLTNLSLSWSIPVLNYNVHNVQYNLIGVTDGYTLWMRCICNHINPNTFNSTLEKLLENNITWLHNKLWHPIWNQDNFNNDITIISILACDDGSGSSVHSQPCHTSS